MSRFYGYFWQRESIRTLAVLPRIRLTTGRTVGVGFAWLTAWWHVWLWRREHDGVMLDLLPHLWLHWHPDHGSGAHLWWLHWRWHVWFRRGQSIVSGDA